MSGPDDSLDLSALRMNRETRAVRRRPRWRTPAIAAGIVAALVVLVRVLPLPMFLPKVETTTAQVVTPAQARTVLTATGYTYARERAAVGAKIVGRVVKLGVDEGDTVKAGDMIAVLDSDNLRAAVASARGRLAQAEVEVTDARREEARQKGMLERGLVAQTVHDAALTRLQSGEARVQTARADVHAAEAQAAYTTITAPISGIVVERNVEVGEMVAPGGFTSQQSTGAIVRIANLESLEMEADINESFIARVRIGQLAIIKADGVPDRQYRGRLRQIVPTADRQRGTVKVKVTIEDRDERLVPDMSSTVSFLEPGTQAEDLSGPGKILVPQTAVITRDGKSAVFGVEDGRLRRIEVTLGEKEEDQIVVSSGLKGGEAIARTADEKLADGKRVRAVQP